MRTIISFISILGLSHAFAAETPALKSFDGFGLEYTIDHPAENDGARVVILIHGSGASDMNEDLAEVSSPTVSNRFFVDVADALTKKGFTVVRYNKRSFQWKKTAEKDPSYVKSAGFKKFVDNPLKYFVEDAASFAKFAHKTFPKAKIYLLGHSEGTQVALQIADKDPLISGTGLIGFTAHSMDISMFEQTVYRSLPIFQELDLDKSGALSAAELKADTPVSASLRTQLPLLDLNGNGLLERSEFMAGNYANILLDTDSLAEYRRQEAAYKKPAVIIKDARFDIAFFQGELDNQAPSYTARSIQMMNNAVWKKPNLHFHFFEGLGHALDKRASYYDILYRPADPQALEEMAAALNSYWPLPEPGR